MIFKILFFVIMIQFSYANQELDDTISYDEYIKRVCLLLIRDANGDIYIGKHNRDKAKIIFPYFFEIIHDHFRGNKSKLAAFTSVLLVNYRFDLNYLLFISDYNIDNQNKLSLRLEDRMRFLSKKINVDRDILFNQCIPRLTVLQTELEFFDLIVQEYSFENLVRLFIPTAFSNPIIFRVGQDFEYAFYILKMGSDVEFFKNSNNFYMYNIFEVNNQPHEDFLSIDSLYDSAYDSDHSAV